jgi:acetyltransferase-like isoleucine patch superfamily enzyme
MKKILKRFVLYLALVLVSPILLIVHVGILLKFEYIFNTFGEFLSLFPGRLGSYLRLAYYKGTLESISDDVVIEFGSFFSRRTAVVKDHVYIGAYCILGSVILEDNVLIASRVSVTSGKNQHGGTNVSDDDLDGNVYSSVKIGASSWIGEGSIVMANVGENTIIGSGSVVVKDIPDRVVAVGNPAKPRSERKLT